MCGRYTLTKEEKQFASRFAFSGRVSSAGQAVFNFTLNYNVAPTQMMPVVLVENGKLVCREMQWGLTPVWAKYPLINAMSETVDQKSAFKKSFSERRCLIPADGFYEWKKPATGPKVPFRFMLKDNDVFFFAGIWSKTVKKPKEDETVVNDIEDEPPPSSVIDQFTILTTSPNELLSKFHNRMPVILHPNHYDWWLEPDSKKLETLKGLCRPYDVEPMKAYRVNQKVNFVKNNSPDLIRAE